MLPIVELLRAAVLWEATEVQNGYHARIPEQTARAGQRYIVY